MKSKQSGEEAQEIPDSSPTNACLQVCGGTAQ